MSILLSSLKQKYSILSILMLTVTQKIVSKTRKGQQSLKTKALGKNDTFFSQVYGQNMILKDTKFYKQGLDCQIQKPYHKQQSSVTVSHPSIHGNFLERTCRYHPNFTNLLEIEKLDFSSSQKPCCMFLKVTVLKDICFRPFCHVEWTFHSQA